jgi:hypothetical protein
MSIIWYLAFFFLTASSVQAETNHALSLSYAIVSTGQTTCYNSERELSCSKVGVNFSGQDAQHGGQAPVYILSNDGLTVTDQVTGLTWQRSPAINNQGTLDAKDKLTWEQARMRPAQLNEIQFGGYQDWRLPSIKELYSLINFNGQDLVPGMPFENAKPFIDTNYFNFVYGREDQGERPIDSQYATDTLYSGTPQDIKMFGVNFADGRIKGYGLYLPGRGEKTFYVMCVRGNPAYGTNHFVPNGDGVILDKATGLQWTKKDSGDPVDWPGALAYVREKNHKKYLGYQDWRLPNAKELQSIVDYQRSPDATNSAAIDPIFQVTNITNEAGQRDYPYYWTSTTHANPMGGHSAVYIAFGRAMGYMRNRWMDVHGAGAQRSDPKVGDPSQFPRGHGPQGDAVHIYNFVRLVRSET